MLPIAIYSLNIYYRCLPATELTDKGPKASNQHAKLAGILKDEAVKFSLSKTKRVPALSVVSHTNTDAEQLLSGDIHARNVGYNPGEVPGLSWSRDKNTVPIKDYKHEYFENMKGHDFRYNILFLPFLSPYFYEGTHSIFEQK